MQLLAPAPDDDVLEVGCGTGVAAELILQRLTSGTLTAIDRSAAMIAQAERRNEACVRKGTARFHAVALEEADLAGRRFDRVLAVNVNRFWLEPRDESALWAPLLKPGAGVYLVYQPPAGQPVQRLTDGCSEYLRRSGFAAIRVQTAPHLAAPAVCIGATWKGRTS